MSENKFSSLGLFGLRAGIGAVFLLFGFDKLSNPGHWIVFFPSFLNKILTSQFGVSVYQFLRFQGLIESIVGIQLLLGVMTRSTAVVAVLILALIIYAIGFDQIGIRDIGLLCSAFGIICLGPGDWSLDARIKKVGEKSLPKAKV